MGRGASRRVEEVIDFQSLSHHRVGSSPGGTNNFNVGRSFSQTCGASVVLPVHIIVGYPYVYGLPPPVKAGRRHITLKMSVRLKTQ